MTGGSESIALFPLPAVLFPGAGLSLRIFEQRYLDMVRDCARHDCGFGVVCGLADARGNETRHARVGTEAVIGDFTTRADGLLGIRCIGRRRFRVTATGARDDGLLLGEVAWLAPEPAVGVPARFGLLQNLMQELAGKGVIAPEFEPDLDDAASLGMALAAALPLEPDHAQAMLEMTDPVARLEALVAVLQ